MLDKCGKKRDDPKRSRFRLAYNNMSMSIMDRFLVWDFRMLGGVIRGPVNTGFIYIDQNLSDIEAAMTLAHEIGHWYRIESYDSGNQIRLVFAQMRSAAFSEAEANKTAIAILKHMLGITRQQYYSYYNKVKAWHKNNRRRTKNGQQSKQWSSSEHYA